MADKLAAASVARGSGTLLRVDAFRYVIEQLRRDSYLGSLYALSLTCKFICEHALNAMWYSMSTLVPLLGCFPDDVMHRSDGEWLRTIIHAGVSADMSFRIS